MDRRTFVGAVAAYLGTVWHAADAQPARLPAIGFLGNGRRNTEAESFVAFRRGLRDLGWVEGRTVTFIERWADGNVDRLPALVADLVQLKVEVIFVAGTPAIRAAQRATRTIPIVFVVLSDPVAMGFVPSLARPGGNTTGMASQFEDLIAKQAQLLKEALPGLSRVALLHHAEAAPAVLAAAETATRSLGLAGPTFRVAGSDGFENAFKAARNERAGAILVLPSPFFSPHRGALIELAARYRLPAFYELAYFVQDGGLMSYGPSLGAMFERAATHVDRILKGVNPGELAIERPTKFELVINLKTAAALGLTIPQSLLGRADEVIR